MSHSNVSYSRMAASALLAVSAGACVGVALSFTSASSLYTAPVAVRTVTQVPLVSAGYTQRQAVNAPNAVPQWVAAEQEAITMAAPMSVNPWTIISGGILAAAAAAIGILYKSNGSEEVAILAASGKKAVPAPAKKPASQERLLWYPTAVAPEWLDGSSPGDRGFDPVGFSKPAEYLQVDLDGNDISAKKNFQGKVIGRAATVADQLTGNPLSPWSDVYGLNRMRECEAIHGRWAMLAVLGCLVGEAVTGIAWQNAGLVEATEGAQYFNNPIPFTGTQLVWFEVLAMGTAEIFRNTEMNPERRVYPGGPFDPLGLASGENGFRLKEAEAKHGRLAMLAFLGFALAALRTGEGATEGFSHWAGNFI